MATLTANNERVQTYMNSFFPLTKSEKKKIKEQRLKAISEALQQTGQFFSEIFPSKQKQVLDEILYLTAQSGIWKIGAESLSQRTGVSIRTVGSVIKKLKQGHDIFVAYIKRTNKYIFVDCRHENFIDIMDFVFNINADTLADTFAERQNAESVDTKGLKGEKSTSNYNSSFILLNMVNIINNIYNNAPLLRELKEQKPKEQKPKEHDVKTIVEQQEVVKQYAANEYQMKLFQVFAAMDVVPTVIKNDLYKCVLRLPDLESEKEYNTAKNVLWRMCVNIADHATSIHSSVASMFRTAFESELEKEKHIEEKMNPIVKKVPFYNWLEERD